MNTAATQTSQPRAPVASWGEGRGPNILAAALLALGLGAAGWAVIDAQQARTLIAEQNRRLVSAEQLLSTLKDLETGERGFALTGVPSYLEPYDQANASLDAAVAAVGMEEQANNDLIRLVQVKREFARQVVEARRSQGPDAALALVLTGQDKASMDAVRVSVARMQGRARDRMDAEDQQASIDRKSVV